jgi:hypothetical protein
VKTYLPVVLLTFILLIGCGGRHSEHLSTITPNVAYHTQVAPEELTNQAQALISANQDSRYAINSPPAGRTKCNFFVQDLAHGVFQYDSFSGLVANDIVNYVRAHTDEWLPVIEPAPVPPIALLPTTQDRLNQAQSYANQGRFVLVGWKDPSETSGHVAVIVPGDVEASGTWSMNVPQIAQAGMDIFAKDKLSQGFGADKKNQIVIYKLGQ